MQKKKFKCREDAQALVQEEVTEKITGYSLDMTLVDTSLVIEVCTLY